MTTRRQPFRDGVEAGDDALHSSPMEDGMMETVTNAAGRTVPASEVEIEVRYKETDQMGVVHHSNYLVWFELARTHHCRAAGMAYREIEDAGYWLMVTGVQLRYRGGARYGDRVRVRCWLESAEEPRRHLRLPSRGRRPTARGRSHRPRLGGQGVRKPLPNARSCRPRVPRHRRLTVRLEPSWWAGGSVPPPELAARVSAGEQEDLVAGAHVGRQERCDFARHPSRAGSRISLRWIGSCHSPRRERSAA